jgi:hypothetical protein
MLKNCPMFLPNHPLFSKKHPDDFPDASDIFFANARTCPPKTCYFTIIHSILILVNALFFLKAKELKMTF